MTTISTPSSLALVPSLEPRYEPLFTCPGHVSRHRSSLLGCSFVVRSALVRVGGRENRFSTGHRTVGVTSLVGLLAPAAQRSLSR